MEFLRVNNHEILTTTGAPVQLRGVCIGGWMNTESFINGYPGIESNLRAVMANILGASKARFFFDRWLDYIFSEADIVYIKQCGANVIRIPLNYRHFEQDKEPYKYLESGFERLNRVLSWCARHELYAILDLHAAPGWQNPDWHSDNPVQNAMIWQHPHFQDRFVYLWQEIARRFQGHPEIAGYDLMNEPLSNAASEEGSGAYSPDWNTLNHIYRRTVEAIRAVDPEHIIFLEGDGFSTRFFGLEEPYAANLAYSSHNYNRAGWGPGRYPGLHREGFWDRDKLVEVFEAHEGTRFTRQFHTPLWVGEFGAVFNGPPDDYPDRLRGISDQISVFEQYRAHWTYWTYKDLGIMGWLWLKPESEYMQRVAPILQAKLLLHTDSWMYWLPSTTPKALLGDLAQIIQTTSGTKVRDAQAIQGQLVKVALGGYAGSLLQASFANCFKDLSEVEIDALLKSFAIENCQPNQGLMEVFQKYLQPKHTIEPDHLSPHPTLDPLPVA